MRRICSFRPFIHQTLRCFAEEFWIQDPTPCTHLLSELVSGMFSYGDEGDLRVPLVICATDPETILKDLKGNNLIPIGDGDWTRNTIRKFLRHCGPLGVSEEWGTYLVFKKERLEYGIFRTDCFPLHDSSFQLLKALKKADCGILGFRKSGRNLIDIRASSGRHALLDSAGLLEAAQNPSTLVSQWVEAATLHAPEGLRDRMGAFYHRIAAETLSAPHGTLVAVVECGLQNPVFLSDGIQLRQGLGIERAMKIHLRHRSEASSVSLSALGSLIKTMLGMDGITVFNSAGEILAYNCFARETEPLPAHGTEGGARKRAYEILCRHVGSELTFALFRSQDGLGRAKIKTRTPRLEESTWHAGP